jgi:hypothetical protein
VATEPKSSNQPDIYAILRGEHSKGWHDEVKHQHCPECIIPSLPPMPSTLHNVHNQRRVIT